MIWFGGIYTTSDGNVPTKPTEAQIPPEITNFPDWKSRFIAKETKFNKLFLVHGSQPDFLKCNAWNILQPNPYGILHRLIRKI